jgi:hypothetical protein
MEWWHWAAAFATVLVAEWLWRKLKGAKTVTVVLISTEARQARDALRGAAEDLCVPITSSSVESTVELREGAPFRTTVRFTASTKHGDWVHEAEEPIDVSAVTEDFRAWATTRAA